MNQKIEKLSLALSIVSGRRLLLSMYEYDLLGYDIIEYGYPSDDNVRLTAEGVLLDAILGEMSGERMNIDQMLSHNPANTSSVTPSGIFAPGAEVTQSVEKFSLAQLDRFDVSIAEEGNGYRYIERNYCADGDYVEAYDALKIIDAMVRKIAELEKLINDKNPVS